MRAVEAERLRQEAEKLAEQERIRKGKYRPKLKNLVANKTKTTDFSCSNHFAFWVATKNTETTWNNKKLTDLYFSFNLVFQRRLLKLKKRERRRRKKSGLVRRQRRKPRRSDLKKKNRKNFKNKSNKKD